MPYNPCSNTATAMAGVAVFCVIADVKKTVNEIMFRVDARERDMREHTNIPRVTGQTEIY
jgi:hypothetical protein